MTFVHRIWRLGLAAGLLLVALVAISPALGADTGVNIVNATFEPDRITVSVGDTVTWTITQAMGAPHTVTSAKTGESAQGALFDSQKDDPGLTKLKDEGATYAFTFEKSGTYPYLCIVHPGSMKGEILVLAPGESPSTEPPASEAPGGEVHEAISGDRKLLGAGILAVTLIVPFAAAWVYRRMNPA